MVPDSLLENVWWSFCEPIPQSPIELIDAVIKYRAEILSEPNQNSLLNFLTSQSPLIRLNVTYTYAAERSTGEWDDFDVKIRVDGNGKHLTYAEILWKIHKAAYQNLKDRDHHYFEGLYLVEDEDSDGTPTYDLILGS